MQTLVDMLFFFSLRDFNHKKSTFCSV